MSANVFVPAMIDGLIALAISNYKPLSNCQQYCINSQSIHPPAFPPSDDLSSYYLFSSERPANPFSQYPLRATCQVLLLFHLSDLSSASPNDLASSSPSPPSCHCRCLHHYPTSSSLAPVSHGNVSFLVLYQAPPTLLSTPPFPGPVFLVPLPGVTRSTPALLGLPLYTPSSPTPLPSITPLPFIAPPMSFSIRAGSFRSFESLLPRPLFTRQSPTSLPFVTPLPFLFAPTLSLLIAIQALPFLRILATQALQSPQFLHRSHLLRHPCHCYPVLHRCCCQRDLITQQLPQD